MAKNNPYTKVKTVEVSSRSLFGRPSEMDKVSEKWINQGWELSQKKKVQGKDRYTLTFTYHMSDEEIAAHKKQQRNSQLGCLTFVVIAVVYGVISSGQQAANQSATQTAAALAQGTRIAQVNATRTQQSSNETATATLWTPTYTFTPSLTPTQTDTATITPTPSITFTPSTTYTPSSTPTITDTPIPTNTLPPSPTVMAPPTSAPAETYYVSSAANIRTCPRTSCEAITTLQRGTAVRVIGWEHGETVSGNDVWRRIIYNGQELYIHSALVTVSAPPPTSAPVQVQQAPVQPAPISTMPPAPPVAPASTTWNCSGDIYNCSDFSGRCGDLMSYWNTCPGDPSRLDQGGVPGKPCESICG